MPKRAADKQLTDRNVDEVSDEDEVEATGEFKKASAVDLSKRQIKGLPGRRNAPVAAPAHAPAASPVLSAAPSAPVISTNGIGNGVGTDANTDLLIKLRGLNVSAVRALGDLTQRVAKDQFLDLSAALLEVATKYAEQRRTVSAAASSLAKPAAAPAQTPAFAAWTGPPIATASQPKEAPKAASSPAPPASFTFGGAPVAAPSKTAAASSGGFTPTFSGSSSNGPTSVFNFVPATPPNKTEDTSKASEPSSLAPVTAFNSSAAAAAAPKKPSPLRQAETVLSSPSASPPKSDAPAAEEPKKPLNPFAGFSFAAAPVAPSTEQPKTAAVPSAFKFGAATNSAAPSASAFSFHASASAPASSAPPAAASASASPFASTSKPVTPPKPLTSTWGGGKSASPPGFGAAKSSPFGVTQSAFGAPNVGFTFGGANGLTATSASTGISAPPASGGSAFGSAPSSGFGFVSASATPTTPFGQAFAPKASTSGSTFGATSATGNGAGTGEEFAPETPEQADSTVAREGQGEENEDLLRECRARVFKNDAKGESTPVVNLKLKRDRVTGVTRLLARHEGNNAVIINARLFPGFKAALMPKNPTDKSLQANFVFQLPRIDEKTGKPAMDSWRARVKTAEIAQAFMDAANAEAAKLS